MTADRVGAVLGNVEQAPADHRRRKGLGRLRTHVRAGTRSPSGERSSHDARAGGRSDVHDKRVAVAAGTEEGGPVFGSGFGGEVLGRAVESQRRESRWLTVGAKGDLRSGKLRPCVLQKVAVAADNNAWEMALSLISHLGKLSRP